VGHRRRGRLLVASVLSFVLLTFAVGSGAPPPLAWLGLAAAHEVEERAPAEERRGYDSDYLFAMTRGVADSTLITPLKPPVFLFTIPLDIVCLPVAAIAGLF